MAGMRALIAWEARGAEADADRAVVQAGLGPQLIEALETFAWLNAPPPHCWHALLVRAGSPTASRIQRVSRALALNSAPTS